MKGIIGKQNEVFLDGRVIPCRARPLIFIGMREVALKPASPPILPSLQSLRIFRSQPRVSSINFKAALDATCNTFSGALTDAWPLFPPVIRAWHQPL